jgi:hypothetical protein
MGKSRAVSKARAELFEVIFPLMKAMYDEFSELSKKKPEAALNKAKVSTVNRLLLKCKELLDGEPSLAFLDQLDETMIPQNSDVVLCLSQYVAAMKQFQSKYSDSDIVGNPEWNTRGS